MLGKITALAAASLTIGTLALPGTVFAHVPKISVSCEAGINVDLTKYHGTDHVKIRLDGVLIVDTDFNGEFHFHQPIGDQTKSHRWLVKVIAGDEASPRESGTTKPCAMPIPPEATTTTSAAPATTTSVALAIDVPPVPSTTTTLPTTTAPAPPGQPTSLPATGSRTDIELAIAFMALVIGWCLLRIRRSRA
jgi:hypothetical protein